MSGLVGVDDTVQSLLHGLFDAETCISSPMSDVSLTVVAKFIPALDVRPACRRTADRNGLSANPRTAIRQVQQSTPTD